MNVPRISLHLNVTQKTSSHQATLGRGYHRQPCQQVFDSKTTARKFVLKDTCQKS